MARNLGKSIAAFVDPALVNAFDASLLPGQTRTELLTKLIRQHLDPGKRELETLALKAAIQELLNKA